MILSNNQISLILNGINDDLNKILGSTNSSKVLYNKLQSYKNKELKKIRDTKYEPHIKSYLSDVVKVKTQQLISDWC